MDPALRAYLSELYEFGRQHDATHAEHSERMLNITPDTGELLRMLVIAGGHRRVLELGTSDGYSTLWLADGCRRIGGKLVTIEKNPAKYELARRNFRQTNLDPWIEARLEDVGDALRGLNDFDLVFLDTERSEYVGWWPLLKRSVRRGGLLVVDNATSHPAELAPFAEVVKQTPGYSTVLVPIGNGELCILKDE